MAMFHSKFDKSVNVVIVTSVFLYGVSVTNDFKNIFILSRIHPLQIRQLIDRDNRQNKIIEKRNIFYFNKNKMGFKTEYNKEVAKYELLETKNIKIDNLNELPNDKHSLELQSLFNTKEDNYLIEYNNGKFEIDNIGVEHQLFKDESIFLINNPIAFLNKMKYYDIICNEFDIKEYKLSETDKETIETINESIRDKNEVILNDKIFILFEYKNIDYDEKVIKRNDTIMYKYDYNIYKNLIDKLKRFITFVEIKQLFIDLKLSKDGINEKYLRTNYTYHYMNGFVDISKDDIKDNKALGKLPLIDSIYDKTYSDKEFVKLGDNIFGTCHKTKSLNHAIPCTKTLFTRIGNVSIERIYDDNKIQRKYYKVSRIKIS